MPDNKHVDPSGNTEAFRAFIETPQEKPTVSLAPLVVGFAVVALAIIGLSIWFAVS